MVEINFDLQRFTVIENSNPNTLISGTSSADSIKNSGYWSGSNYIYASNVTINGGSGNDSIRNEGPTVIIRGEAGNDSISNAAHYVTMDGGADDDFIGNYCSDVSINGGAGSDTIHNSFNNVTIGGGAGNDSIRNYGGVNISIIGGTGSDTITLEQKPISSSSGTSYIGGNVTVIYNAGDGNDIIQNFSSTDTLSVKGGTCSSVKSGDDIIVTIDDGKITLAGAANLSKVNIKYVPSGVTLNSSSSYSFLTGTSYADSLYNDYYYVTINAGDGNDKITNSSNGYYVSINAGNGNDTINNIQGYEVSILAGAGNDSVYSYNYSTVDGGSGDDTLWSYGSINGGAGNDRISLSYTGYYNTIKGGSGNDTIYGSISSSGYGIIYQYTAGDGNDIVYSYTSNDTLQIGGGTGTYSTTKSGSDIIVRAGTGTITLKSAASLSSDLYIDGVYQNSLLIKLTEGNDTYKNTVEGATINALGGSDKVTNQAANVSISGGTGNDSIWNDAVINYVTIQAGAGDDSIMCWGSYNSIDAGAGNDYVYRFPNKATVHAGTGNDRISLYSGSSNGDLITYNSGDGNDTIYNIGTENTLKIGGGTGTYSTTKSGSDIIVTVGTGKISLIGAASLSAVNIIGTEIKSETNSWKLSGTTATYGTSSKTLITVNGVKSLDGLSLKDKVVTVSKSSVNATKITISDGYTLKLGSDVSAPKTTNAWSLSDTTATVKQTTTAGYKLSNNAITYTKKSTKTLATVSGVKSVDGLSLSGKVVTISKASLGTSKVTISDGYTLKLGSDVTAPKSTNAWSLSDTTATLKQTTTAGYKLSNNAITYTKKATKTLATVSGVKSVDGISLSGKVVTISKASLGTSKVTISDGYTLKLGSDVTKPSTKKAAWTLKNSTATYKSSYKTAGYTLASDSKSISYSKATTASTLATIKGVTSTDGLTVSGKTVKLAANSLAKKVTVGGSYAYDFAEDYKSATITGSSNSDTIAIRGTKISVNSGAGDDTIKIFGAGTVTGGDGADTFAYKSIGANVIADYAAEDKISIASGTAATSTSGDDLILTIGKGKISVKGGKDKVVTYYDADGEHVYRNTPNPTKGVKFSKDGKGATLTADYTGETFSVADYPEYANTIVTINAAAAITPLEITANNLSNRITGTAEDDLIDGLKGADRIYGGDGNDTLLGGAGNDSLNGGFDDDSLDGGAGSDTLEGGAGDDTLWGGAGNDTLFGGDDKDKFLYYAGDGDDVIADFNSSLDKIIVMKGLVEPGMASGDDVIFNVESGSIIVQGFAKKAVKIYNSKNTVVQNYKP